MAYGRLELKPWDFGRLQPHEFIMLLEGYAWRCAQQESLFAYFVCHLMNVEGKCLAQPIGVADLLEPVRGERKQKRNDDKDYLLEQFKHILGKAGD
ncbi:MAG: hypothetical protein P4N59_29680 [Negativicutes bacterium]|nr:hypothetical protein [Negativicutes bacterium]